MNKLLLNQPFFYPLLILVLFISFHGGFDINSLSSKEANQTKFISIELAPNATIEVSPKTICLGDEVIITFTGTGGNGKYTFYYTIDGNTQTEGPINGNSTTVQYTPNSTGDFDIVLTAIAGNDDVIVDIPDQPVTIKVSQPIADFSFINNSCSGTPVLFTSNGTGNGPFSYLWSFGDGDTSSAPNPSHIFTSLGCTVEDFNVTLTITDNLGCSDSVTKVVTIKQKPDIGFYDLNPGLAGQFNNCGNSNSGPEYFVEVGNSSNSNCINTFNIDWGDGTIINNVSFPLAHNYLESGTFYMVITGIGDNGCSNSITYTVKNATNPSGGISGPGNTVNLCAPTAGLQFEISGWGTNTSDTTYEIDFGDGSDIVTYNQSQLVESSYYNSTNPSNSLNFPVTPHSYIATSCPSEFTVKLWIINACKPNPTPATISNIIIVKSPEAKFEANASGCVNNPINFINTTEGGFGYDCSPNSTFTWDFGDGSPTVTTNTIQNVNHVFASNGVYNVTLTASNNFCDATTFEKEICIEPSLNPTFLMSNNEGCAPFETTLNNTTDLSESCEAPTYLWNIVYTSGYCGTSSQYNFTNGDAASANPSIEFTNPGIYTISLSTTNSCGTVTSAPQSISIKQPPTAILNSIDDFCGPTTISPVASVNNCSPVSEVVTYAWSFPGGIPATSNQLNPGTINYNSAGNYQISFSVTNSCGTTIRTEDFSINPLPTITNTDLSQTICSGTLSAAINLTTDIAGSTFSWTGTAPAGVTGYIPSGNSNVIPAQTIFNSNATSGTLTYTVTPISNGCQGPPVNFEIIINPSPEITDQPLPDSVCLNGTTPDLNVNWQGSGTPTYQWYENTVNNNTTGNEISGETSSTFSPPTDTIGIKYYYVIITFSSGGCNEIPSNPAKIEVVQGPQIITQPLTPQSICIGGNSQTLTVTSTGGTGSVTYQWYSNTTNSNSGGNPISGETANSYTPPAFTTTGNYYYYVEIQTTGNGCGAITSDPAEIIVVDDPVFDSQPIAFQELCQNASVQNLEVTVSGGLGNVSYQWYSNNTNSNTGGTLITGATTSTYTPPTNTIGSISYYCVITQNVSGCTNSSDIANVVIIEAPTIENQPLGDSLCLNGITNDLSVTYINGSGTATYQWYENTVSNNTSGTEITGEISNTFSPPTDSIGVKYYYVIITFSSGGCNQIPSNPAKIEVVQGPQIITQPLTPQSICIGGNSQTLTVTSTGGTGSVTYQWYSNTTNSNSGGNPISGATANSYTPPAFTTTGNYYYYVEIQTTGNGCGAITSDPTEILVVDDPVFDSQPIAFQELCQNASVQNLEVSVSGGLGNVSYQWYSNNTNSNTGGTLITGATTSTYTPPANTIGSMYYYCVITQNVSGCTNSSDTANVVITPAPIFSEQPISDTLCLGDSTLPLQVSYINGTGVASYQWYQNTIDDFNTASPIVGEETQNYSPPVGIVGTTYYYCEISFSTGGCSKIISSAAQITISQVPVISNYNDLICSGNPFTITPDNANGDIVPSNTTYTWTTPIVNPSGTILGTSAQTNPQNNISQLLTNTTTNPVTVTYTITPISGICTGIDFTITITVNPSISVTTTTSDSSCYLANTGSFEINITGGVPFTNGNPYLISWVGPNGYISNNQNISNLEPGDYTLTINDDANCPFNETYSISEPDELVFSEIIFDPETISCFGANNGSIGINVTGGTLPYQYSWTKDGVAFSNSEDLIDLGPGNYEIGVTDINDCGPIIQSFNIVEPELLNTSLANQVDIICYGDASGEITVDATGGRLIEITSNVFDYNYSWVGPNGFTSDNQNLTGLIAGTYSLTVTDKSECIDTLTVILNQPDEINIDYTTTDITCYGDNNASIIINTISGGNAPYNISWSNLGSGMNQNNLSAGDYIVTIADATNCLKSFIITIDEAPIFRINPIVNQISCFGENDGRIILNLEGGLQPLTLFWDDNPNAGDERNNLPPGTYSVTIIDSTPCEITETFVISEPNPLQLSANIVDALDCNDANSGSINLIVTGGTLPMSYNWSNGSTVEDLNQIPPGNYSVTITDANGCVISENWDINRFAPLIVDVETITDFDCETKRVDQSFVAQVNGGVPPYQISWSSGLVSGTNNEIMNTSQNGLVIIDVYDSIGCSTSFSYNVTIPVLEDAGFETNSIAFSTYGYYSIQDPIQFTNTSLGDFISIMWDFGDGNFSSEENPVHTFVSEGPYVVTQTVTYPFGCVYTKIFTLVIEKGYSLILPNAFTPNDDGLNDYFLPKSIALSNMVLNIYNTWGSLIYSESGEDVQGWDGKINDKYAENGNYYFTLTAQTFYGKIITREGAFVFIK